MSLSGALFVKHVCPDDLLGARTMRTLSMWGDQETLFLTLWGLWANRRLGQQPNKHSNPCVTINTDLSSREDTRVPGSQSWQDPACWWPGGTVPWDFPSEAIVELREDREVTGGGRWGPALTRSRRSLTVGLRQAVQLGLLSVEGQGRGKRAGEDKAGQGEKGRQARAGPHSPAATAMHKSL